MDLYGIGYSNIRLPNNKKSYIYTYDPRINIFPEEVFVHEFLHSLERNLKERGYKIPDLHSYEEYGYELEKLVGLREWYADYMSCNIRTSEGNTEGLDEIVYTLTPPAESDFKYSVEVQFNNEPNNAIEETRMIGKIVLKLFGVK